jgi:hypothetical protein
LVFCLNVTQELRLSFDFPFLKGQRLMLLGF